MKIWLDNKVMDADQVHIAVYDRGFTLGDGLFETMLWTGTHIRFLSDHMARLATSAAALSIPIPFSLNEIKAGLTAIAGEFAGQTAVLRLTLTRGSGPRGLALPDDITPMLLGAISGFTVPTNTITLASVAITRHSGAPSARHKTLSYIDNIMALNQARTAGGDDAIMQGTSGYVACASSANIVINYKGQSLTPAVEDGALPGIVRGRLLAAGLIEEAHISTTMLAQCTSCVLTNALTGVREVIAINGRALGDNGSWLTGLREGLTTPVQR